MEAGDKCIGGMVIGENSRQDDLVVNVTIKKTNQRSCIGTDDKAKLIPVANFHWKRH